ncbi:Uncharacterized protein PCOAH_00018090 [Plasmodium coatneyi]|uniref:START domain-containing protein n=1 Tax=Plasmodium coatneyi TaxID=208452 RepID=A0A1B1DWU6_9APIC|nr:Uncharacterized protein PCOAH_00018090 [Plasmodium coatneyi]ANQ07220.1 Uncharacterized protein PCOAH_00018090 [Plasmodium coatneyi]
MEVENEIGQNASEHLKKKKKKKHEKRGNKRAHTPKTDIAQGINVCNKKSRKNSHNENEGTEGYADNFANNCADSNPGSRTYNRNDIHAYNGYHDQAHDAGFAPEELERICDDQEKVVHAESKNYGGVTPDGNEDTTMSTYDDNTIEEGDNTQHCDMHDAWITLCQYFNCMQKKDHINEEDTHSELAVPPNQFFKTSNFFCHKNNFFCSEHEEDHSTVNSVDGNRAGGIFCWSASHHRGEDEQCGSTQGGEDALGGSGNANMSNVHNIGSLNSKTDSMGGELPVGGDSTHLDNADEENDQGEKQKKYIRIISKGKEESNYDSANNLNSSSSLLSRHTSEKNNLEDLPDGNSPPVGLYPLISRGKIDRNVIFIQVRNFSQKIDEYISDEKIFRAQKLILHVKKYVEYYINYFKKINDEEVVQMLTNYYEENCTDKNGSYNVNRLKAHIIFYFLNFFRLHEMSNMLQDYSYYFSLDKNNSVSSDTMSNSLDNNTSHTVGENANTNRKSSTDQPAVNSDEGLPCGLDGEVPTEQNGEVKSAQSGDEKSAQNGDEKSAQSGEVRNEDQHGDQRADPHSDQAEEAANPDERPVDDHPSGNNQDDEEEQTKRESQVIVDKIYHHQCNGSSIHSSKKVSIEKKNSKEEGTNINTKGSNRHMVKIIQKYSRRFKNFRKIKQNKEGWIKENDKYLDLWHRVDSDNNISVHIRGKLPYDVSMILSIISETELSTHWVPFLTSAQKIKSLSKSSALITQLYEYPIIGKKESLMYGLGANTLEELGCIILCCMCPPELKKDIEFFQNMCNQMNINKNEEILKVKETPLKFRRVKREVTFFDCQLPDPTPKIDRQRAANLCFLIYPLNNGKSTVLELFVHFENEFKYTPIKMVTYFIKKIVKNMYANIIKTCKNYHTIYADRLNTNQEFYLWLNDQIKKYTKSKHQAKFIDSMSLESYHEPENNDPL